MVGSNLREVPGFESGDLCLYQTSFDTVPKLVRVVSPIYERDLTIQQVDEETGNDILGNFAWFQSLLIYQGETMKVWIVTRPYALYIVAAETAEDAISEVLNYIFIYLDDEDREMYAKEYTANLLEVPETPGIIACRAE